MSFICLYQGRQDECVECGGWADPKTALDGPTGRVCSADCADSAAESLTCIEDAQRQRRQAEDDFAAQVAQLRERGFSYEEIDDILQDVPT
jgi:hypothetical protein